MVKSLRTQIRVWFQANDHSNMRTEVVGLLNSEDLHEWALLKASCADQEDMTYKLDIACDQFSFA